MIKAWSQLLKMIDRTNRSLLDALRRTSASAGHGSNNYLLVPVAGPFMVDEYRRKVAEAEGLATDFAFGEPHWSIFDNDSQMVYAIFLDAAKIISRADACAGIADPAAEIARLWNIQEKFERAARCRDFWKRECELFAAELHELKSSADCESTSKKLRARACH